MSKIGVEGEITARLNDEQFLYFAGNSSLGILLIQRGHLIYFNKRFAEIFGYSEEEVLRWKKREFYKIIHPEDLAKISQKFYIEDERTVSVRFRGVKKNGEIILIENFVSIVYYNGKKAFSSTYLSLKELPLKMMYKQEKVRKDKKILLDYHPDIVKLLRENDIKFAIIKHDSFKGED